MKYSIILKYYSRMIIMFAILSLSIGWVRADCNIEQALNHDIGKAACANRPHFANEEDCILCVNILRNICRFKMNQPMSEGQYKTELGKCSSM